MNKKLINLLVLFWFLVNIPPAKAQHLQRRVFITAKQEKLYKVLNRMEEQCGFNFSYSGDLLKKDSLLSIKLLNKPVWEALNQIFDYNVEYHETGNYIVLRSAEHRFSIFPEEISADSRKYKISGYVLDERTGEGVKDASVYEKKLLRSALTNHDGYFSLKFRGEYKSVMLTASKENYRDTSMFFLTDVKISPQGYYDDRKTNFFTRNFNNTIERFGINKFLVSSKRQIQSLNIPAFFANSPFQASLFPGLGSQGLMSSQIINKGSLNMIGGYSAGVNGAEIAGVFNITKNDVKNFQSAGVFNITGGDVSGMQISGLSNTVFGKVDGGQFSGVINQVRDSVEGGQFAGLLNQAKQSVKGIQFSGLLNLANENVSGVQIAGLFNQSKDINGVQFAGSINIARKVKGVQIAGFINIADSSDYPIGVINIIKKGEKSIGLSIDEQQTSLVSFRSGGKTLYGIIGLGYNLKNTNEVYAMEIGLGAHFFNNGSKFRLNTEFTTIVLENFKAGGYSKNAVSVFPAFRIAKNIEIFAGASLNYLNTNTQEGRNLTEKYIHSWNGKEINNFQGIYAGYKGGINFVF